MRAALLTADPLAKVMATRSVARRWRLARLQPCSSGTCVMPDQPAWPDQPELVAPRQLPRRGKAGSPATRIALWHSLAHIEFVAIDLALDMAGRFGTQMGPDFTGDFLAVAADEAMHFSLLARKLTTLGSFYGALPAHGGLWQAACDTRHDVAARLAIVPMVLEARGLDITPQTIRTVEAQGDRHGVRILERILADEIRHVRFGTLHFTDWCKTQNLVPQHEWQLLLKRHFRGALKPPFNSSARKSAGLPRSYLDGIV
ncbi:ferritin-like domain-containing protein [Croceicoccus sp. F390]|uniref:Ferritin-like domain-containing protein n=1 Tax=Croceicoccus esteveae TaxID=3075597 RepID=A0ABU2ZDB8_9SPHN|nr:ferritin-like domain-containing protein [Croceicoccus sp. F390]MDT0574598.1 ferritin-like domain-containing protein [Croceicoccus sp. F390]